ncbi:hypothetical protein [Streptomyces sp. DSM 15324]|uniref:hypothetical protein n=1 Tax=Streptomyces sp. DSM 15324 TaxID=1739111 RepID=UPI000748E7C1|nr:hypothetical protein [Streptomyces sp. DSM 15324]KUO14086.1 hypothetical protein AQJ58_03285 [Streptomyces sp. DSM 15324]
MTETTPNSKGPAPIQLTPEVAEPVLSSEVRPEDIATLAIEYHDGQPIIVASGGKYVPVALPVVAAGNAVAASRTPQARLMNISQHEYRFEIEQWSK